MSKIAIVIGSRPQYIKLAPFLFYLKKLKTNCLTIDTCQHYDYKLSELFIRELKIKKFDYKLNVKSKKHGEMTALMMIKLEEILTKKKPRLVIVFGDTNSTLAASIVSSKLKIPIAHIESGMRAHKYLPEEINRIITDRISTFRFCSTKLSLFNLKKEGLSKNSYFYGDITKDNFKVYKNEIMNSKIIQKFGLNSKEFSLLTLHRENSVITKENLFLRLNYVNSEAKKLVLFPIHPKTRIAISKFNINLKKFKKIKIIDPLGYFDTLSLIENSDLVFTDSGGVQKESFYLRTRCIILRSETEWPEIIEMGWGRLWKSQKFKKKIKRNPYGNGIVSLKILKTLDDFIN